MTTAEHISETCLRQPPVGQLTLTIKRGGCSTEVDCNVLVLSGPGRLAAIERWPMTVSSDAVSLTDRVRDVDKDHQIHKRDWKKVSKFPSILQRGEWMVGRG